MIGITRVEDAVRRIGKPAEWDGIAHAGQRMPETCAKALRGASMQGKVVLRAGMTRVCLTYRLLPAGSPIPRVGSSMGSGPFRPTSTLRNGEKKSRVKDGTGTPV